MSTEQKEVCVRSKVLTGSTHLGITNLVEDLDMDEKRILVESWGSPTWKGQKK